MLNRNAARHLLLVVSILLCAFIYAGYYLATRGDDAATDAPPAPAAAVTAPASATPATGAGSLRPSPAADPGAISGLIPETMNTPEGSSSGTGTGTGTSGMMPGANLPIPGFAASASPDEGAETETRSVPVLALPGMGTAAATDSGDEPPEEEDFGDGDFAAFMTGDDEGDFAALPGSEPTPVAAAAPSAPASTPAPAPARAVAAAPVLPPPPGATIAPPPPAPAAGTGTALRPPPAPAATAAAPVPARNAPPPAPAPARVVAPPPPPPAPRAANGRDEGMAEIAETEEPEPRSDSLRIYVVAPGDTLSSIAMRELGSGFLADNIFLLNRDVIEDPNHLMVGAKIRLPYANPAATGSNGGSGNGTADAAAAAVSGEGRGAAPGRRPTQGLGGAHTVVRGDTLSSIAQQYYGTSSAWRFLYEANKTTVPNPNQLTVGMELAIPPYEE